MRFSLDRIQAVIRPLQERAMKMIGRKAEPRDPFSGDDLFDGEPGENNLGPKIALAVSGVAMLSIVGIVTALVMMGGEAAPPVGGSLADIQVVDDPSAESAAATAATDRSVERRPWLTSPAPTGSRLMGVDDDDVKKTDTPAQVATADQKAASNVAKGELPKPAGEPAQAAPPAAERLAQSAPPQTDNAVAAEVASPVQSTSDLLAMVKRGGPVAPALTPPPTPPAAAPRAAQPTEPIADAKPAADAAPVTEVATANTAPMEKPSPLPTTEQAAKQTTPEPDQADTTDETMVSSLAPAGIAPGAPARMAAPSEADAAPVNVGGRPRLSEPRMPPIDKAAVNAPPPRYAALTNVVNDASPATTTAAAKITVIVEGLGLSKTATEAAIDKLPRNVTLAFSPYARNLRGWLERAKAKGHEVLVEVPMESKAFPADDPGPLGLLTVLDDEDNAKRLDAILTEAAGAAGIYDRLGSKFRESDSHIDKVFAKLKEKNLFYVQGRPGVRVGDPTVPTASADVVIDERPFRAALDARLDYTQQLAKYQGAVVAVMSATPVSLERFTLWYDQLPAKDAALAPVSQVLIQ